MPLRKGKSKDVVSDNIRELRVGATYERTKRKFGAAKAHKQAVAIALKKSRER